MNFDMPKASAQEDVPKNGSEIEFVPPTEEEAIRFKQLIKEGQARNEELGGDGRILSSAEKAAGWFGEAPQSEASEWAAGLEKPVEMVRVQAEESKDSETPEVVLGRQISDIAGKMAEVLSDRIRTTDDAERMRLQKLEETLKRGLDIKKREYDALVPGQAAGVDSVASEEHFSA
jgi:hypothetical protein